MTDEQISDQVAVGIKMALDRYHAARPRTNSERNDEVIVAYMSGANQIANFLVRADGTVTPQQVERALAIVAGKLGFHLDKP